MRWLKATPSEHDEQAAYFHWVTRMAAHDWKYSTIFAIPNGGHRHIVTAMKLKAEGVRVGVWDIHIPLRFGRYIGAWVEMKSARGRLTKEQIKFGALMQDAGHLLHVCYSASDAIDFTQFYFNLNNMEQAA